MIFTAKFGDRIETFAIFMVQVTLLVPTDTKTPKFVLNTFNF